MSRRTIWMGAVLLLLLLVGAFALGRWSGATQARHLAASAPTAPLVPRGSDPAATRVYAHNLSLRKGSHFRIFVRWIRGTMQRTRKDVDPSFDNAQSFVLQIQKGILSVKFEDLDEFLNTGTGTGSSLHNIELEAASDGGLEMHGTLHKFLLPLPVKVSGSLTPLPDGRVQFHLQRIDVLKMPMKRLLGAFHVELSDLVASPDVPGIEIEGNDIRFDTLQLLPPPHIHGQITAVVTSPGELRVVYGGATGEDELAQWHNFLRFEGGSLGFGKLTMHDVDLTMIDASQEPWFDLDLVNYQTQLVNSYTRMTAKAGLEIYMPDLDQLPQKKPSQAITLEWLRNRNSALPSDVPFRNGKPVGP